MRVLGFLSLLALFYTESNGLNCYSGYNSTTSSVSNCQSCQTAAIFFGSQNAMTVKACLPAACVNTDNVVSGNGVKVLCCSTDNCNNQVVTVSTVVSGSVNPLSGAGSGTFRCYNENMTISTGCNYCMKSITNLFVTSTVTRSCQSVCVPVTTQVFNTQCCQADLCNHAFSVMKSFPRALVFTLMVVLGKYIVV